MTEDMPPYKVVPGKPIKAPKPTARENMTGRLKPLGPEPAQDFCSGCGRRGYYPTGYCGACSLPEPDLANWRRERR